MRPAASVLIATYRRQELLAQTLHSLQSLNPTTPEWELVVVDNDEHGSAKPIVDASACGSKTVYLREARKGKNFAVNTGLDNCEGDLIVFSDDDIVADPGWIQALVQAAGRWQDVTIFGGRVLPLFPGSERPFDLSEHYRTMAHSEANWNLGEERMPAAKCFGANFAVRRSAFETGERFATAIGPAGSKYMTGSETELVVRLERRGHKAIYVPDALVHHVVTEEQMQVSWLRRRAFGFGRGDVAMGEEVSSGPRWFGVPRYLWRQVVSQWLRLALARVSGNRRWLERYMDYWRTRGLISGHREKNG